jgi:hypothetical protein
MSKAQRFDQDRKDEASEHAATIAAVLATYYSVPDHRIVSTETIRSGEYGTAGEYIASDLLDYAGVDWLVDARPAIVPVGERLRPASDEFAVDFSWRVDNGCDRPCEGDRVPAGLRETGLCPREIVFGRYDDDAGVREAIMLDTATVVDLVEAGIGDTHRKRDGTEARYIPLDVLRDQGAVLSEWDLSGVL